MKKLINGADTVLEESLDGFAAAHADILLLGPERKFVRRRNLKSGAVTVAPGAARSFFPRLASPKASRGRLYSFGAASRRTRSCRTWSPR